MNRPAWMSRKDTAQPAVPRVRGTVPAAVPRVRAAVPKWIDWLPRGGWPVVAMIVMIMCAPGEHRLARMAGYHEKLDLRFAEVDLAWGMPACLVAYAGIAASVATRRVRGTQGRVTAILGAFLSLGAALAAQPISHMFVTGHWDSSPAPVWIVWAVSAVPPLALGHLMHMAASHTLSAPASRTGQDRAPVSRPRTERPAPDKAPAPVVRPDVTVPPPDTADEPAPDKEPVPVSLTKRDRVVPPDALGQKRDLTELVRSLRDKGTEDEDEIKKLVRDLVPDVKPDSLRKAIARTRTA